jgi:hypothetical protein
MPTRCGFPLALAASTLLLWGCPDDPTKSHDLGWVTSDPGGNARVEHLDASGADVWTYLSFAKGVIPTPGKPEESLDWDVAFQRYNVKTNGGTSGKGQGAAADLGPLELQTTMSATVTRWTPDAVIADARTDEKRSMNSILSGWYSYHFFKHELVSDYHLYAVRAADGRTALFKVHDYYDDAGTPAKVTVLYRFPVDASETGGDGAVGGGGTVAVPDDVVTTKDGVVSGETNFDARGGKSWALFTEAGLTRLTDDPGTGWDLSFKTWLLQTNSGTSGGAGGGAMTAGTTEFASATTAPGTGWLVDGVETIGAEQRQESTNAALAGWFEYDPTTQKIRSQNQVVWIRTHDGRYTKLQIVGYYHPDGSGGFYRLRWAFRPDGGKSF